MGLKEDIGTIKGVSDGLTENKVSQFAYDSTAYDNNMVEGEDTYNINDHNCIPKSTLSILKINATVRDKGWRARASSLTRMLINHMLGRTSYNLNKVNDLFNTLLLKLYNFIGSANGLATLDADGRIPYSQLPESAVELKGYWDASTNTPTLADGTGDVGDEYYVSVAGSQNLGSGIQYFNIGDRVLYLDGMWRNINATAVKKVNNIAPDAQGNVSIGKSDIGLSNVQNVTTSDTPVTGGTDNFSTGGAQTMKDDILSRIPSLSFKSLQKTIVAPLGNTTVDGWGSIDGSLINSIIAEGGIFTYLNRDTSQANCPQGYFWVIICPVFDAKYSKIKWAYADDFDLLSKIMTGGGNTLVLDDWSHSNTVYAIKGTASDVTKPIVVWFDTDINARQITE